MSIKFILATFLTAMIASLTSGCGGSDELSVVQPNEEFLQQMQEAEDLEKASGKGRPI